MASTINSSGTSSGIIQTADASGILNLQGGGTTGISISAAGIPTVPSGTLSVRRAAGTYGIDIVVNNDTGNTTISPTGSGAILTIPDLTISGSLTGIGSASVTTVLGANYTGITNTWTNIVNTGAFGAAGQKWLVLGIAQVANAATANASMGARLYDATNTNFGPNYVHTGGGVNYNAQIVCMGVVTLTAAANYYLQVDDFSGTNGGLCYQNATYIMAVRLS